MNFSISILKEGVIEEFSYRDHDTSRIVSAFVVGDCDDESEAQREEYLRSCVDAVSGDEQWIYGMNGGVTDSSPVVAGDLVVLGTINDTLHTVDATSGERAWVFEAGDDVDSSPAVVDGTVFVGSNDATVYAIGA